MTRYVFEEVQYRKTKTLPCSTCGKSVRRSTTFTNTINPWNLNAAGEPASRSEIIEKLRAKADAWMTEPVQCTPCIRDRVR